MADVFISYARADEDYAGRLAERLTELGLEVWWDRRLGSGDRPPSSGPAPMLVKCDGAVHRDVGLGCGRRPA